MNDFIRDTSGALLYVVNARRTYLSKHFKNLGLHESQHRMLMYIDRFSDTPPTQIQIANFFDISAAAVAVTIRKLEKGGYITRTACENDMRNNRVFITEKGKEVVKKSNEIFDKCEEITYRGMSEEDIATLRGYLDKIYENVHGEVK